MVGVLGVAWRAPVAGVNGGDGFPSARERRFMVDSWGVGSCAEGSCRGCPTAGMGSRLHGNDDSSWIVGVFGSYAEGSCRGNPRRGWVPVCTGTTIHRGWLGCWELRGGLLSRVSWVPVCTGTTFHRGWLGCWELRLLSGFTAGMGSRLHGNDGRWRILWTELGVIAGLLSGVRGGMGYGNIGNNGYSDLHQDHQEVSPWRAITGASPRRCRSTG